MRPTGNKTGVTMSSTAIDLTPGHELLPGAEGNAAPRGSGARAPLGLSGSLLDYWRIELPRPVAARRGSLERVCRRVRHGVAPVSEVLPFALGDTDAEVVYRATVVHLAPVPHTGVQSRHLHDAVDWIRRRLALNRAAVFAALLSLADEAMLELLRPLRLLFDERDCEWVQHRLAACPSVPVAEFVRTWSELRGQPVVQAPAGAT